MTAKQKFHKDPRISVNKLAEYLSTNKASRRERILQDSKFPPTFQTIRYDRTREIIQKYLSGTIENTQQLQLVIDDHEAIPTKNDFELRNKKSNTDALKSFLAFAPTLDFSEMTVVLGAHAPHPLVINDVTVSVRPDLTITSFKKGATQRGAIKLNISKGSMHTKDSSEYASSMLRHYLTGTHDAECDYRLCYTLDVFGKKLAEAPKAITNRLKDADAACAEIARQWDFINPP